MRTMTDMGMGGMAMEGMKGMPAPQQGHAMSDMQGMSGMGDMSNMGSMSGMDDMSSMGSMSGMAMGGMAAGSMGGMQHDMGTMTASTGIPTVSATGVDPASLKGGLAVDNVAMAPISRLEEAGDGLDGNGRRNLTYAKLAALSPDQNLTPPTRAIEFHLTGNMERFVWGFDGKTFSEAPPVNVKLGERVRFILINDTMMEHPIHLHGFFFALENGQGDRLPLKHTVNVKPGEKLSFVFTADTPGHWAFHCHLLYHMATGMFRTILVS